VVTPLFMIGPIFKDFSNKKLIWSGNMLNWSHCNLHFRGLTIASSPHTVRVHAGLPHVHCCWKSGLVRWHLTASSRQQRAHCGLPCHTCAGRSRHKKKDVRSTSLICTGVHTQLYTALALSCRGSVLVIVPF